MIPKRLLDTIGFRTFGDVKAFLIVSKRGSPAKENFLENVFLLLPLAFICPKASAEGACVLSKMGYY